MKAILNRAMQIIKKPRAIWSEIDQEHPAPMKLFTSYFVILAAIPAAASLIGLSVVGIRIPFSGVYRMTFGSALVLVIVQYLLTVAGAWLLAKLIFWYAPKFEYSQDPIMSFLNLNKMETADADTSGH